MTIIFIPPGAGEGLASAIEAFGQRFGKWAPIIWIICGLLGVGGQCLFGYMYMRPFGPIDGPVLFLGALMLFMCLLAGPFSIPTGPVMIGMFWLFDHLERVHPT